MVEGGAEPGIVADGNVSEDPPLGPTGAICVAPLIVTDTVSLVAGNTDPDPAITPDKLIELVPAVIVCDFVSELNPELTGCTVMVAMVRNSWVVINVGLLTVIVAVLM